MRYVESYKIADAGNEATNDKLSELSEDIPFELNEVQEEIAWLSSLLTDAGISLNLDLDVDQEANLLYLQKLQKLVSRGALRPRLKKYYSHSYEDLVEGQQVTVRVYKPSHKKLRMVPFGEQREWEDAYQASLSSVPRGR